MNTVISKDAALEEIENWADWFETEIDEDAVETLLPAVMRGRITFDQESEKFTIRLRSPITLENGEKVESVTMREPIGKELMYDKKRTDDMAFALRMYSKLSGQPLGVIERLKERDLVTLSGILGFFA